MEFLRDISRRHEDLKRRIHSFRIPLSPTGQRVMGFVYFCIPVIGGYYIMQAAISRSQKNLEGLKVSSSELEKDVSDQNSALGILLEKHNQGKK